MIVSATFVFSHFKTPVNVIGFTGFHLRLILCPVCNKKNVEAYLFKKDKNGVVFIAKRNVTACAGVLVFLVLFFCPSEFVQGVAIGLKNSATVIVPSLFPAMVASSLVAQWEMPRFIKKPLERLTRCIFGQPAECIAAVFAGLFGGYPSGARAAAALCESGKISCAQAKRLMLFCVNAGVGFCINALGISLLNSHRAGVIIFVSLITPAFALGVLTKDNGETETYKRAERQAASATFTESVASGASGIITVCAFSILFSGLLAVISKIKMPEKVLVLLACMLEITSGCASAAGKIPLPLICSACAFGGLCVHMQIFASAGEHKPDLFKFYLFRLAHAVLSYVVCRVLLYFFPVAVESGLQFSQNVQAYSFSLPAAISLLFFSSLLIFELDKQRKIC